MIVADGESPPEPGSPKGMAFFGGTTEEAEPLAFCASGSKGQGVAWLFGAVGRATRATTATRVDPWGSGPRTRGERSGGGNSLVPASLC